jgi:CDP-diacylglycerol--glycerol-3-phosphate 3-phosphatidyltransferase
MLSCLRVLLIPTFVTAFVYEQRVLALGIFTAAALTDLLDGFLARSRSQQTSLGNYLDPIADKFLLLTAFSLLRVYDSLPPWMLVVVFTRETIVVGGWVIRHILTKSSVVAPRFMGKLMTLAQMLAIGAVLLADVGLMRAEFASLMLYAAMALTAISALDYLYRGVKELGTS